MADRRKSLIETISPSLLQDLKDALERFHSYKITLLESYNGVTEMFNTFYKMLDETDPVMISIKNEIETELMPVSYLKRDPIILISGQVNSGKSSLVNEILETSLVPVESTPCTSRIVKIKYSEESFYQIFDKHGKEKSEKRPYGRKTREKKSLRNEIKLRSDDRVDPEFSAEEVVEIGVNSDILKRGIQIVDTPGMNENKTLDKIVKECVNGVLQILIYVIDANPELREADDMFLNDIKEKAPNMHILFVCNKCEENEKAKVMDQPDDEGEESDVRARPLKGEGIFRKLKDRGHLLRDEDLTTCDHFFRISCRAIRRARHGNVSMSEVVFVQEFQRFITQIIGHFQDCVKEHLYTTANTLYALATRAFDFFMSDRVLTPVLTSLRENIEAAQLKEKDTIGEIVAFITNQKDNLHESIRKVIDKEREKIIAECEKLDLKIYSKKWTNDIAKRCNNQLIAFLVQKLSDTINSTGAVNEISDKIEKNVTAKIRELYDECRNFGDFAGILTQLESCYDVVIHFPANKQGLLKVPLRTRIELAVDQFSLNILGPKAERICDWKRNTTRKILGCVVAEELGEEICRQLSLKITSAHGRFLRTIKVLKMFCEIQDFHFEDRFNTLPVEHLSRNLCTLKAVRSEIVYGDNRVVLSDLINKVSSRCDVFRCRYRGEMAAARRCKGSDESQQDEFAKQINYTRLLESLKCQNMQRLLDVYRDKKGLLYAIVPYIEDNLFHMLWQTVNIPLRDRLHIAYQIVQACAFAHSTGIVLPDLRPNNVMMNGNVPVLNTLKPLALKTPYPPPDGMPPFHFSPVLLRHEDTIKRLGRNKDVTYSSVILIWWLAMGKFVRPRFADTTDLQAINAVITKDFELVRMDMNSEFARSTARRNATGVDAEMLDEVQKLLDINIDQDWNNYMDIQELQHEMERILKVTDV